MEEKELKIQDRMPWHHVQEDTRPSEEETDESVTEEETDESLTEEETDTTAEEEESTLEDESDTESDEEEQEEEEESGTLVRSDRSSREDDSSEGFLSTWYPVIIGAGLVLVILIAVLTAVLKKERSPKKRSITTNVPGSVPMELKVYAGKVYSDSAVIYLTDSITIGSRKDCDLVVEGNGVEPVHARIARQNDQVIIEDLNSNNGVAIGGMRIQDHNPLRSGDMISVGEVDFSVVFR